MFSCPEAERTGYHEAVWFMHQLLLGSREDMDAMVGAIDKVVTTTTGCVICFTKRLEIYA